MPDWNTLMPHLVNALPQSAIVLLLATAVTLTWRRASAATRHLVWTLAILACLALPVLQTRLPAMIVVEDLLTAHAEPSNEYPPHVPADEGDDFTSWPTLTGMPHTGQASQSLDQPVPAQAAAQAVSAKAGPASLAMADSSPPTFAWRHMLARGMTWLPWVWALGAAIALFPLIAGWISLALLGRSAQEIRGGSWRLLADELSREIGLRQHVTLLQSDRRVMPMTWGFAPLPGFRPKVLLPHDAHAWNAQRRRAVLLHELAHVRRLDCLTQTLTQIACAMFCVNPLVWLAAHRMLIERELACDDLVLSHQVKASDYAEHLLQIVADRPRGLFAAQAGIAMVRQHALTARIAAMLDPQRNRQAVGKAAIMGVTVLFGASALGTSMLRAQEIHLADPTLIHQNASSQAGATSMPARPTLGPAIRVTFDGPPAYLNFQRKQVVPMDDALARAQGKEGWRCCVSMASMPSSTSKSLCMGWSSWTRWSTHWAGMTIWTSIQASCRAASTSLGCKPARSR